MRDSVVLPLVATSATPFSVNLMPEMWVSCVPSELGPTDGVSPVGLVKSKVTSSAKSIVKQNRPMIESKCLFIYMVNLLWIDDFCDLCYKNNKYMDMVSSLPEKNRIVLGEKVYLCSGYAGMCSKLM